MRERIVDYRRRYREMADHSKATADVKFPEFGDDLEWLHFCRSTQPLMTVMLRMDQPILEMLLELQTEWMVDAHFAIETLSWLGNWIYAELGCLHLPLEPNVHNILRDIARECTKIRHHLSADCVHLAAPLNLIICIISSNFDQVDLADV